MSWHVSSINNKITKIKKCKIKKKKKGKEKERKRKKKKEKRKKKKEKRKKKEKKKDLSNEVVSSLRGTSSSENENILSIKTSTVKSLISKLSRSNSAIFMYKSGSAKDNVGLIGGFWSVRDKFFEWPFGFSRELDIFASVYSCIILIKGNKRKEKKRKEKKRKRKRKEEKEKEKEKEEKEKEKTTTTKNKTKNKKKKTKKKKRRRRKKKKKKKKKEKREKENRKREREKERKNIHKTDLQNKFFPLWQAFRHFSTVHF